jgi:hypothetical protein
MFTDLDHVREFDRRELSGLVEGAGLTVLETDHRLGVLRMWCSTSLPET